jgi:hypothetical protein
MLEALDDSFIIVGAVRVSGDCGMYVLNYLQQVLAHIRQDIFDTGGRGKWNDNGSGRDSILSVIII